MGKKNVLVTVPSLKKGKGGVTHFYRSMLSYIKLRKNIVLYEIGSAKSALKFIHPIWDQIRFIKALTKKRPCIVHVNPSLNFKSFIRDGLFIFISKKMNCNVMVFFHGWDKSFETSVEKRLMWFFNNTFLRADIFFVLSKDFKSVLKHWGVNKKIVVANTPVDDSLITDFFINERLGSLKKKSKLRILFLSRIEREKGIFETIDAFRILLNKGYDVSLYVAGDGGALGRAIKYSKDMNIPDGRISFLGYLNGINKIDSFKSADIYCFPTFHGEGMPTSVLEAMAFGLPIITRPVGGIKDFFENGKMGYCSESKEPEEIAMLIERLINDREKIAEISMYNHDYATSNFLSSQLFNKISSTYNSLMD